MWAKSHSITTKEISSSELWAVYTDINNWHKWDDEIEYAKLEGEFAEGKFFELKPKGGPKVKIQIIKAIQNKQFKDLTKFPLAKMYGNHEFEETPEGLKVTVTMTVEGPLGFIWRKLVAEDIVKGLPEKFSEQVKYAKRK
jgi:hypothetical protein